MRSIFLVSILMATVSSLFSQQVPDLTYDPPIAQPAYKKDVGTDVFIDEGHHNFHTKDGRYAPFNRPLEKDGYNVKAYFGQFESRKLAEVKILVIANALNEVNAKERNWILPNPSAFTDNEIEVIKNWVSKGGSLFLIADHMPFAGAAEKLGATFGFTF
ncbi:MAG: hypothetical protein RIA63_10150, partial [Cyclobacteriaceae bacterium]